jgi:UDP-N-acetylglucosamine 4,6-dehydratase
VRLLITGGTGALGRALVSHLRSNSLVERLCVLSRDEHKVRALADQYQEPHPLRWFVGDIRDQDRLKLALQGVDVVIHAAALKRIDAVVNESLELDKTNVRGTVNVLEAALACGVRKVLVVSSDKAVQPTNAYGCTKMLAECHAVGFNAYSKPRGLSVSCVRYGNVFGSTGSILHIWRQALKEGKPLPMTSPNMTRFHLTIAQAVEFCISSVNRMIGGEIFVPDLPAWRLRDLADAMLDDTEMNCGRDHLAAGRVTVTGLRPGGEKLAEIMLSEEEPHRTLWQDDRYLVMPAHKSWSSERYRGECLKSDPCLKSDWPARWLTVEQLRKELACAPS